MKIMKSWFVLFVIAILVAPLAQANPFWGIKGNGHVVKQERSVKSFNAISVGGAFEVFLTQGDSESLVVEADENLLEVIETKISHETLYIRTKENIKNSTQLNLYITIRTLEMLDLSGAVELSSENRISGERLEVESSGASEIELDLKLERLSMDISGASEIDLYGKAEKVDLDLSGASELDAYDFFVVDMNLDVSGAGEARVNVSGALDAEVSGAASIRYKGSPSLINTDVSGAGSIRRTH